MIMLVPEIFDSSGDRLFYLCALATRGGHFGIQAYLTVRSTEQSARYAEKLRRWCRSISCPDNTYHHYDRR